MFNARCETVSSKSAFSRLLSRRRCVVPVQGFYEWKNAEHATKADDTKQPFYVHAPGDSLLLMAALYDVWDTPAVTEVAGHGGPGTLALPGAAAATASPGHTPHTAAAPLYSYTVLTTDSGNTLQWLHSRQPVLLTTPAAVQAWLDTDTYPDLKCLSEHPDESVSGMFRAAIGAPSGAPSTGPAAQGVKGVKGGLLWHPVTPAIGKASYDGADCAAVWDEAAKARRAGGGAAITAFFKPSPTKGVTGGDTPTRGTKRSFASSAVRGVSGAGARTSKSARGNQEAAGPAVQGKGGAGGAHIPAPTPDMLESDDDSEVCIVSDDDAA